MRQRRLNPKKVRRLNPKKNQPNPKTKWHEPENYLKAEAMDHTMQLPLEDDLQEIRLLVCDLQKGWESLLMPTTSSSSRAVTISDGLTSELLA